MTPTKRKYYWLGLLLALTALVSLVNYNVGMIGLTTFVLAYLSKGTRKTHPPDIDR